MKTLRWLSTAVLGIVLLAIPAALPAQVAVGISVRIGPPALPVYAQPICPGDGYIWVPGYWAYADDGYYWVPGTWVFPPEPGLLWTPGYWGFVNEVYVWHAGYWGPHVGFYGGIDYGFGYPGTGFYGGYWNGGRYYYNRSVTNVNVVVVHNVYERNVIHERNVSRVSYNGGRGGVTARPTREEIAVEHERHFAPTRDQQEHRDVAAKDRRMFARENHGRPDVAATARPGDFHRNDVARPMNNRNDRPPNADRPRNNEEMNRPKNDRRNDRPPTANLPNGRPNNRPEVNNRPNARPPEANRPNNRPSERPDARPDGRPNERPNARPNNRPNDRPPSNRPNTQGRSRPNNPHPNQARPPQQERPHPNNARPDQARPRPAPHDNHQRGQERPTQQTPHPNGPNRR